MVSLREVVNNDLKQAMHQRDKFKVSVLRMFLAALKNKEIAVGKNLEGGLTSEEAISVVKSEIKKRKEAIMIYKQGGRQDLADKEIDEVEILKRYLPRQLGYEELEKIVREVIKSMDEASMKNFGQIIKQVMAKVKGRADGSKVSEIVKKELID